MNARDLIDDLAIRGTAFTALASFAVSDVLFAAAIDLPEDPTAEQVTSWLGESLLNALDKTLDQSQPPAIRYEAAQRANIFAAALRAHQRQVGMASGRMA
jgi:hypothetical protein